jgi:hypothetical protein
LRCALIAAERLYRVVDLKRALQSSLACFSSPLIKPLAPLFRGLDPGRI